MTKLIVVLFVALATLAWASVALADSEWGDPRVHDKDMRCVEHGQQLQMPDGSTVRLANAPYYEYEYPTLLSYLGDNDETTWLGWAYADACTSDPERKGATYSNVVVDPRADYSDLLVHDLRPLESAVPDAQPDPQLGKTKVMPPGVRVPVGIDGRTGQILQDNGFVGLVVPGAGGLRILLDSSRDRIDGYMQWWDVHGRGPWYAHDPDGFALDHREVSGGIARVWVRPANLLLLQPSVVSRRADRIVVQVDALFNTKRSRPITTPLGYHWASEGADATWHQLAFPTLQPGGQDNWIGGLEVPLLGSTLLAGQADTLYLKINPSETHPDDETSYSDNVVSLDVAPVTDLQISLAAPDTIPAPVPPDVPQFTATAWVRSREADVDTVVHLIVTKASGTTTQDLPVHLAAGADWTPVNFTVNGSQAGDTIYLSATVNPDRSVAESDYDNDTSQAAVIVEQQPPPAGDNAGDVGGALTK